MKLLSSLLSAIFVLSSTAAFAAEKTDKSGKPAAAKKTKKPKKKPAPFKWVNKPKGKLAKGVAHGTYHSRAMDVEIGYCIYLPPSYSSEKAETRYPVVYYLHGGRPGSELKSVNLATQIREFHVSGEVGEAIYVFVNGGLLSHYNMPQFGSWGEWTFVHELIPHIDKNYRTIAKRSGRGIEGFSQGGRGTARIMFKYPELFVSAAPGGGGHATEKRISETGGWESDKLKFIKGANTWDRARKYAKHKEPKLNILAYVGDKGFNYENNLEWTAFLKSLGIGHRLLVIPDAPHSGKIIYDKKGAEIMQFHMRNFEQPRAE
jgi:enterochelin esterase-like enzyme